MAFWIAQNYLLILMFTIGLTHTMTLPWGPYVISRAGRASPSESWYRHCCALGLKAEVSSTGAEQQGGMVQYNYCSQPCCTGLEESTIYRKDGTMYTYCRNMEPELNSVLKEEISDMSLDKLYELVRVMVKGN